MLNPAIHVAGDTFRNVGSATNTGGSGFLGGSTGYEMPSGMGATQRRQWLEGKSAEITRSQWQNFLDTYRPTEQAFLEQAMQTDFQKEGDEAGLDAARGVRASRGMLARQMSRLGTRMTAEEAAAVRRRASLAETRAVGRAENTTRRTLSDTRTNMLAAAVGLGRQVATGAAGGISSAANNAAATESMLRQGAAQASATNTSAATALATALIFAI